eukprot:4484091-Pyramimonas_sp.AAC.1
MGCESQAFISHSASVQNGIRSGARTHFGSLRTRPASVSAARKTRQKRPRMRPSWTTAPTSSAHTPREQSPEKPTMSSRWATN